MSQELERLISWQREVKGRREVEPSFFSASSDWTAKSRHVKVNASTRIVCQRIATSRTVNPTIKTTPTTRSFANSPITTPNHSNTSNISPPCLAITQISSCAARPAASPSAAFATNATANAPSATPTCAPQPSYASATSAPSATTRTSASSAAVKEFQMHSIASSARALRRTGMGARRS